MRLDIRRTIFRSADQGRITRHKINARVVLFDEAEVTRNHLAPESFRMVLGPGIHPNHPSIPSGCHGSAGRGFALWGSSSSGLAILALIFFRRIIPAGHDGVCLLEARAPLMMAVGCFVRSLVWIVVGIAIFQAAASLQVRLYGFFLPP